MQLSVETKGSTLGSVFPHSKVSLNSIHLHKREDPFGFPSYLFTYNPGPRFDLKSCCANVVLPMTIVWSTFGMIEVMRVATASSQFQRSFLLIIINVFIENVEGHYQI